MAGMLVSFRRSRALGEIKGGRCTMMYLPQEPEGRWVAVACVVVCLPCTRLVDPARSITKKPPHAMVSEMGIDST
ncbi:MAG: hypothetical protein LBB63_00375 [Holosporaceae bacterium]|jgi:hypothetical protein|nr:hypothetical protein [Holosporaceae bacterium]